MCHHQIQWQGVPQANHKLDKEIFSFQWGIFVALHRNIACHGSIALPTQKQAPLISMGLNSQENHARSCIPQPGTFCRLHPKVPPFAPLLLPHPSSCLESPIPPPLSRQGSVQDVTSLLQKPGQACQSMSATSQSGAALGAACQWEHVRGGACPGLLPG